MTKAAKKKFAVTPASKSTGVGNSPDLVLAKEKTRVIAPKAPRKAAIGTVGIPAIACGNPILIAITAPKAAPLDTPKVNGAARSLRRSDWNTAPATARAAPVSAAKIILGMRARNNIFASTLSLNFKFLEKAFSRLICTDPINGVIEIVKIKNKKNKKITPVYCFRFIILMIIVHTTCRVK